MAAGWGAGRVSAEEAILQHGSLRWTRRGGDVSILAWSASTAYHRTSRWGNPEYHRCQTLGARMTAIVSQAMTAAATRGGPGRLPLAPATSIARTKSSAN